MYIETIKYKKQFRYTEVVKHITKNLNHYTLKDVRGKGLLNALEFDNEETTNRFLSFLLEENVLAKNTHENVVRVTPPLVIKKEEMDILLLIYYLMTILKKMKEELTFFLSLD